MALDPQTMNPVAVENELVRFVNLLERATQEVGRRGRAAAIASADYRAGYARAIVAARGATVSEREAEAAIATDELFRARVVADAALDAARDAARNMREQLGALRTIAASLRELTT
jgi:ribosomal 50S subunit-associated protein YjgA (DUF615 family)